jgi:hypothetical protein
MSFVIRNGRRIEVETVAIGVTPSIRRRAPFVVLPLVVGRRGFRRHELPKSDGVGLVGASDAQDKKHDSHHTQPRVS